MYQVSLHPLINVDKYGQSGDTPTKMCHQLFRADVILWIT